VNIQTSAYDDLEKRMGIFMGLAAFVFSSLACLLMGEDLITFLVRGFLAGLIFTLLGWGYGRYLRRLVKNIAAKEEADARSSGFEMTQTDAETVSLPHDEDGAVGTVISEEDFGGAEDVPRAPHRPAPASDYSLPPLEEEGEDLPPPPVPSGI
jgi:hypothetical protein